MVRATWRHQVGVSGGVSRVCVRMSLRCVRPTLCVKMCVGC